MTTAHIPTGADISAQCDFRDAKSKIISDGDYTAWSQERLIARVTELEQRLKRQTEAYNSRVTSGAAAVDPAETANNHRSPVKNSFDASRYSTRLIALKFAYLGQRYNGFEHHANNSTPLPTIEEEIWKALDKTKLISPTPRGTADAASSSGTTRLAGLTNSAVELNWDGCQYSKCGRTDRGVSAFGQVIGVRVRSNRPVPRQNVRAPDEGAREDGDRSDSLKENDTPPEPDEDAPYDPIADELAYVPILNRVLPPDIRILAWCPNPPSDFSARFSCRERRYKYFFTQPAYAPCPSSSQGWLNISVMREAAKNLEGTHDYRNMCKLDPSKQLTNWTRRIYHADIEEISPLSDPQFLSRPDLVPTRDPVPAQPKIYAIVIHGSAFLWHQVRHIASLLFLIGQGHESPSLITDLLDISKTPCKPKYAMASDAPLVLWDCIFPSADQIESEGEERRYAEKGYEDSLNWIYVGDEACKEASNRQADPKGKWGKGGILDELWTVWRQRKMDEILASQLFDVIASNGDAGSTTLNKKGDRVFDGGNAAKPVGNYVPVMKKDKMESVEVLNERYRLKKGIASEAAAKKAADGDE